jgi:energy-coupling factor transporter ATP-binding protein EcfA2
MLDSTRLRTELNEIEDQLERVATSSDGRDLVRHLREASRLDVPGKPLIWQALHADCLRIAYTAVAADGQVSDDEIEELYEYLYTVARNYAKLVKGYSEFEALEPDETRAFLDRYHQDRGPFGYQCAAPLRWMGLDLCRRAAQLGQGAALEHYERMTAWFTTEAMHVGHVEAGDPRWRARLQPIDELRAALASAARLRGPTGDLRAHVFLTGRRVFSSVAQASSVFEDDPFDVESVHASTREAFERLADQALAPSIHHDRGRMLLILGDSGAGKTHLMRAFRRRIHERGSGFAAYAQLQSRSHEYGRYLLNHVIDSLDRPYASPPRDKSGLVELATGLTRVAGQGLSGRVKRLVDDEWPEAQTLAQHINELVDDLLRLPKLSSFDPDLLRVLLYVLRRDPSLTTRVTKYLRCEDLNAHDRSRIGDVVPRIGADEPIRMIRNLARLAFSTQGASLILMVDQAEVAGFAEDTAASFRRAIDTLHQVVSEVPSAVAVIACLEDLWLQVGPQLTRSAHDRLANDPPIERLEISRSYAEIEAIVARRLAWLYADGGAVGRPDEPIYPIAPADLSRLTNRRTRDILDRCHRFQEACSDAGRIIDSWDGWQGSGRHEPQSEDELAAIAAAWNDHLHAATHEIPTDEHEIVTLLAEAAQACAVEHEALSATVKRNQQALLVDLALASATKALALGVANRSYHRGAFAAQVDAIAKAADDGRTPVIVRTSEFPGGPASAAKLAAVLKEGGRKVQLSPSDLRAIAAMRAFAPKFASNLLARWRRRDRPITAQPTIAALFDLKALVGEAPLPPTTPPTAPKPPAQITPTEALAPMVNAGSSTVLAAPSAAPSGEPNVRTQLELSATLVSPEANSAAPARRAGFVDMGTTVAFRPQPVQLAHDTILRHAGVLGSTGSGKTTLALNLLEQLLEQDIPVVLIDRKGDLAGYARPSWWQGIAEPERRQRAQTLAERMKVRLFTPGTRGGRPLAFGVVPSLDGVPEYDRARVVQHGASALAAMMRLGEGSQDAARRAILAQAIAVLAERHAPASLEDLLVLLESRDDDLIARVGRYDDRLFNRLETDLETLRLNDGELFARDAEQLFAEALLGRDRDNRTPLSIVSTKFLGDTIRIQAWVAHLLVELARWCVRNPRSTLQAVVMLDEADLYMPAGTSKPPSKEPLQDLLKRARSGGLGILLATQSPGDLDYRSREQINTWFVGKVHEQRSIDKLKPLFERKPTAASKLGELRPGRFIVLQGATVSEIERTPSLLVTEQLPEAEILQLASASRPSAI